MAHEYITDDGNDLTPDTALVRCGHGDCTWGLPVKPISRIFEFTGAPISVQIVQQSPPGTLLLGQIKKKQETHHSLSNNALQLIWFNAPRLGPLMTSFV